MSRRSMPWMDVLGRTGFWAGAAMDAGFGLAVFISLPGLANMLGMEVPAETLYVKLAALLLLGLAGMYAVAAMRPEKYFGNVVVAAVLRLAGALWFLVMAKSGEAPPAFLLFALMDGVLGLSHAAFALHLTLRREAI